MFEHDSAAPSAHDEDAPASGERKARRQYTLKGVENEAIDLMRSAADKEGMKIGSWVSLRLRQAAQRALDEQPLGSGKVWSSAGDTGVRSDFAHERAIAGAVSREADLTARLERIETELMEVARAQRSILARLVTLD